ncbi:growth-regulated protein homolog gamma-like isoform X1 [Myotis daubentonii]|uniref:growth-regulated protein homolog gamma-like isoform X1 n=1 Tax=Myotis daubentonii TaxID=98922 RepID=UPI002872E924|nr:growth-regulated protein homolog gamma-like isoform X1 [Myotis daubentonii]
MARTATASAAPRAPGFLRAALLLLLLVAACRQAAGETRAPGAQGGKGDEGWASTGGIPLTEPVLPAAAPMVLLEETVVNELRCQCLETLPGIHPKIIQSVKVTSPGPHCDQTEVIATLKNGQKVCLNPASPLVKKFVNKLLNKSSTN